LRRRIQFSPPRWRIAAFPQVRSSRQNCAKESARPATRQGDNWRRSFVEFLRLPGSASASACCSSVCRILWRRVGGQYDAFVRENGQPRDLIARTLGFGLDSVTVAGQIELRDKQILDIAGVNARQSLPFLDVDDIRTKLLAVPLVKMSPYASFSPAAW